MNKTSPEVSESLTFFLDLGFLLIFYVKISIWFNNYFISSTLFFHHVSPYKNFINLNFITLNRQKLSNPHGIAQSLTECFSFSFLFFYCHPSRWLNGLCFLFYFCYNYLLPLLCLTADIFFKVILSA